MGTGSLFLQLGACSRGNGHAGARPSEERLSLVSGFVGFGADAGGFKLFAGSGYLEALADRGESQFSGYAIAVPLEKGGADLEDFLAIVADDLCLVRILLGIRHVIHSRRADIDFAYEITLHKDGERPVDGGAGDGAVNFASLVQQLLSSKMRTLLKYSLEDRHALAGHAKVVLYEEAFEFFSAVVDRHMAESQYILNSCQSRRSAVTVTK